MDSQSIRNQKGSILVLSFFILTVMSLFVFSLGYRIRQRMQVISRLEARQELRLIGEAAIKKSIYVLLKYKTAANSFDALNQIWSNNKSEFRSVAVGKGQFSVFYHRPVSLNLNKKSVKNKKFLSSSVQTTIPTKEAPTYGLMDEESKLNLNLVQSPDILERLFRYTTLMTTEEANTLALAVLAWRRQADDHSQVGKGDSYLDGAYSSYHPRGGPFASLEELCYVQGMNADYYAKIFPFITLNNSGLVNINTAPYPVLAAIGFIPSVCEKIIYYRNGKDRKEGTSDDQDISDLASFSAQLSTYQYLNKNEQSNLLEIIHSGLLTVQSQYFSARAMAQLPYKKQVLKVNAVFDDEGVIKQWEEKFTISSS